MIQTAEANRIKGMGTSIFGTMSLLAVQHKAVNLGQGFPDFNGPDWIISAAHKAMMEGKNQYAPSNGILSLRQEISLIEKEYYGIEWNPETEITITAGATEALFSAIMALIDKDDEVILFEPFYDSYPSDVQLAGGICKYVTLQKPDFTFDFDELENQITDRTKMIVINSPHNPTGKVFTFEELSFIAKIAVKHNLIVLSDEAYEFMTFDGKKHIPIATVPGMKDRSITVSSTGKTFGMTGWKVGYIKAAENLTNAVRKVHQWVTFTINTPAQHAICHGFENFKNYLPEFRALYQSKKDLIVKELQSTGFRYFDSYGSYFIMVEIPTIKKLNDLDCSMDLVQNFGLATIPTSVFYGKSNEGSTMLRLCFAKQDETIINGIAKLRNYV